MALKRGGDNKPRLLEACCQEASPGLELESLEGPSSPSELPLLAPRGGAAAHSTLDSSRSLHIDTHSYD